MGMVEKKNLKGRNIEVGEHKRLEVNGGTLRGLNGKEPTGENF